jgi:hypothetical protein
MTWDGANTTTNPFADTTDGAPLCFTVGAGQVTQGLDLSVRKLAVGQRARATCIPKMAYGDAGNPPHVPPHAHVVYEIEVCIGALYPSCTTCFVHNFVTRIS